MSWKDQLRSDSLPWLLESENPGVRYLALRDLLELPAEDRELKSARKSAHKEGADCGSLIQDGERGILGQAGFRVTPKNIVQPFGLLFYWRNSAHPSMKINASSKPANIYWINCVKAVNSQAPPPARPSGTIDCLQGNLCWSLMQIGYDDPRLEKAYEWMARTVTGDGIAPAEDKDAAVRYYYFKSGPTFACGINNKLSCAWGGVKVMLALGKIPVKGRTLLIKKAIRQGTDFFLSIDPATAEYPTRQDDAPSRNWWKFGFPVFYITDLLQLAEAMVNLGYGKDKRLTNTLNIIREKQNERGQWLMEFDYAGRTWLDFGTNKLPNKWVTLRALKVLKAVG